MSAEDYEPLEIPSDPAIAADVQRGRQSLRRGKGLTLDHVFGPDK